MKIAIVTGASSGMGREFVYALDREGKYEEIWVIARRADRLESLKTECKTAIRPIALDLGKAESFDAYRTLLETEKPDVSVLVNCAGFGKFGTYAEIPTEVACEMIDLNCKALVRIDDGCSRLQREQRHAARRARGFFGDERAFDRDRLVLAGHEDNILRRVLENRSNDRRCGRIHARELPART